MIKIYGYPRTRTGRAIWTAEEAGIEYDFVRVDLANGEHQKSAYQGLNPLGKVPLLVDGGLVLSESAAICTYIGHMAPPPGLVPAEPRVRALYDKWCFFVIGELEQPLWTLAKHAYVLPKSQRVPAVRDTARFEFARVCKALSRELGEREYLVDERFTVADILCAHTLAWAISTKQVLAYDNVSRYAERILSRPALVRARNRETDDV